MLAFASTPVVRGDQDWIQLKSDPVIVPDATASILVRAALTGKGEARFDDIAVNFADAGTSPEQVVPPARTDGKPAQAGPAAGATRIDPELAAILPGRSGKNANRQTLTGV